MLFSQLKVMKRPYWIIDLWEKMSRFENLGQEVIFLFSIFTILIIFVIALIAFLMSKKDQKNCQIDEESGFDPPPEYSEEAPPPTYDEAVIIEKVFMG